MSFIPAPSHLAVSSSSGIHDRMMPVDPHHLQKTDVGPWGSQNKHSPLHNYTVTSCLFTGCKKQRKTQSISLRSTFWHCLFYLFIFSFRSGLWLGHFITSICVESHMSRRLVSGLLLCRTQWIHFFVSFKTNIKHLPPQIRGHPVI